MMTSCTNFPNILISGISGIKYKSENLKNKFEKNIECFFVNSELVLLHKKYFKIIQNYD
jgi:hypothetical protein